MMSTSPYKLRHFDRIICEFDSEPWRQSEMKQIQIRDENFDECNATIKLLHLFDCSIVSSRFDPLNLNQRWSSLHLGWQNFMLPNPIQNIDLVLPEQLPLWDAVIVLKLGFHYHWYHTIMIVVLLAWLKFWHLIKYSIQMILIFLCS